VLISIVIGGAGLFLFGVIRAGWRGGRISVRDGILFSVALLIWFAPSVAYRDYNPPDDYLAYFTFARRIVDAGTLIEPFSLRRLVSFGGQSFVDALLLCVTSEKSLNLLEFGMAPVMTAGMLYGYLKRKKVPGFWTMVVTALLMLLPVQRANILSQATGIVLFVSLSLTLEFTSKWEGKDLLRAVFVVGMVAAALAALRSNFLAAAVIVCLVSYAPDILCRRNWRRSISIAGGCSTAFLICLTPWMALLYRSSGSPLYPMFKGNHVPGVAYWDELNLQQSLSWLVLFWTDTITILLVVPALVLCIFYRNRHTIACLVATGVAATATVLFYSPANLAALGRYANPLVVSSLMIASVTALTTERAHFRWMSTRVQEILLGCVVSIPLVLLAVGASRIIKQVVTLPAQIADTTPLVPGAVLYRELQSHIPLSEKTFAVLNKPYLLDYSRGAIWNADMIGVCSLPPKIPYFAGPQALKNYLLGHGVHYIAYSDFDYLTDQVEYYRSLSVIRVTGPERIYRVLAPYYLDLMANLDRLAATESLVFNREHLRLVQLRTN
jgi:hypothetical protein